MRKSIRSLIQGGPYSVAFILTLTLVVSLTASLFTVIDKVLLKPLPYRNASEVVFLSSLNRDASGKLNEYTTSLTNLLDWRERAQTFQSIAGLQSDEMAMTEELKPRQLIVGSITANLFETLGVKPLKGRFFQRGEDLGSHPVAILTYSFWNESFGRAENLEKLRLVLDGVSYEVVGVAPPEFFFVAPVQVWIPLNLNVPRSPRTSSGFVQAVGRMKAGISLQAANSDMERVAKDLAAEFPEFLTGWSARAHDIRSTNTQRFRPVLFLLAAGVFLLLLIGCVNVANLALARTIAKQSEIAIHMALGATRKDLFFQFFTEHLLLTLSSGVLALLVTVASIPAIIKYSPLAVSMGRTFPVAASLSLNWGVFSLVLALSIVISVVLGFLPAFGLKKSNLLLALRMEGRQTTGSKRRSRLRDLMVVSEIAMACILLTAAGWIVQRFWKLNQIDPGFETSDRISFRTTLPGGRYDTHEKRALFLQQAQQRLSSVPGFQQVGASTRLPLNEFSFTTVFTIEGRPPEYPGEEFVCNFRRIGSGYFKAAGISVLQGREFDDLDSTAMPVAIVSREFEKAYWPGESAIGKRIIRRSRTDKPRTIIGVVEDVKDTAIWDQVQPTLYVPYLQGSIASLYFVVVTGTTTAVAKPMIESTIWSIDRNLPVTDLKTMSELRAQSLSRPRFAAYLIGIFACAGIFLAATGVFGIVSYSIHQRQHEIGIRIAIGSDTAKIWKLLLGQGFWAAAAGLLFGLCGTILLAQLTSRLDYSDSSSLFAPFLFSAGFNLLIWALATSFPVRRAGKLDPTTVLK